MKPIDIVKTVVYKSIAKKAVFALTAVLALQAVAISNLIEWGYPSIRISDVRA